MSGETARPTRRAGRISDLSFIGMPFLISFPLGGFLFGFLNAQEAGLVSRLVIGLVFSFLTPLTGGYPPRNEGGVGEPYNAWPYIGVAFAMTVAVKYWRKRRRDKLSTPPPSP